MRFSRSAVSILSAFAVLCGLLPAYTPAARAASSPPVPAARTVPLAPVASAEDVFAPPAPLAFPAPQLAPAEGYAGQAVTVRGEAPAGSPDVRLAWFYAGATRTAEIAAVTALSRYDAELIVPFDAPPGPAQVCVAPTGVEVAGFTCTDFTVITAPPGSVTFTPPPGFIPLPDDPPHLQLLDRAGIPLVEVPLVSAGTVSIPNVPVGVYQLAVVGNLHQPLMLDPVVVRPAATAQATVAATPAGAVDPLTGAGCDSGRSIARVGLTPSTRSSTLPEMAQWGLAEFPAVTSAAPTFDFGVYVAGVGLKGTLEVQTQGAGVLGEGQPRYVFVSGNKQVLNGSLPGGNHLFKGEIDLGAQDFTPGIWTLYIYPRNAIGQEFCPTTRQVRFVADPMKSTVFRRGQSTTAWNRDAQRYEFAGVAPNFVGLPLRYPDPAPELPLLGPLKNELEAGLFIQGTMGLDYTMTFTAVDAKTYAYLLNQPLFDKTYSIKPGWMKDVHYNPDDPHSLQVATDKLKLVEKNWKTTVYKGVLASFWGVVTVNAAVNLGLNGELYMQAVVYPLEPSTDITVTPALEPWLAVSVWVDLLLGLASAGADATANLKVELPMHVNTKDSRIVYLGDPCIGVRAVLALWARINLYFYEKTWNIGSYDLIKYKSSGCPGYPDPQPPPKPPRVLGTPVMAADTSGYMAAAYIEDTASGNSANPIPKVMVLVKPRGEKEWDFRKAVALTDGAHMVQDPALTFAHDKIIVAWTETMMTAQEERTAGDNMAAILGRQEIRYAYALTIADNRRWSTPAAVTNDAVADGRPVLAGMSTDGATLAWVRSGGQAGYSRGSTDIALVEYDHRTNPNAVVWGERRIIAADGMDAQPALARFIPPDGRDWGRRALAFVANADGDTTGKARRIRIFFSDVRTPNAEWRELDTAGLPANAMSPSVAIDMVGSVWVAFLVGTPSAPGAPVDPGAALYMARFQAGKLLAVHPVRDWKTRCDEGEPVYAEKPALMFERGYGTVVVFRRFGAAGTNGALGQIALLKTGTWGNGCSWQYPPVYVTDDKDPNWLPTAAVNQLSGDVSIMRVKRAGVRLDPAFQAAAAQLAPASSAARPAAALLAAAEPGGVSGVQSNAAFLAPDADPIVALTLDAAADPALDPALVFDPPYAGAAVPVVITATVRNVGLADVTSVTVDLYRGTPAAGVLVQSRPVAGPLPFGLPVEVAFQVAAGDAPEPYHVVLTPGPEGDMGSINNVAQGVMNALDQPEIVGIVASPRFEAAAELSIRDNSNPAIAGYRILRALAAEGPYELVGLAETPYFADLGLDRMQTYFYKVQSYDRLGTVSEYSLPVVAVLPADQLFLPIIGR